ncbi:MULTISPECIES: TetR/AcrR family transcriptional regulator [Kitasatospora]|uniref:AcrR family transcriptional regulator n=2 Tax=Kitasatospora TaxID=2063 RepID=A0ABT1J6R4_9ACTN|nr:TetR/AcrR family transcriptional regulator [Kitasatospora paracochleata]MCP2312808.1 AcrR family transcriptional regulator [Kitasatospora paracochleata]
MGKQARSQVTYRRILEAAAVEFAGNGYSDTNLQDVADRMELTKGAVYGHFSSKRQLAAALLERLDAAAEQLPVPPALPALARLHALTCRFAEHVEADVHLNAAVRLTLETAGSAPDVPGLLRLLGTRITDLAEQAERGGELAPAFDATSVAELVTALLVGAYVAAPAADRRGLADRVRLIWDALLPTLQRAGAEVNPSAAAPSPSSR